MLWHWLCTIVRYRSQDTQALQRGLMAARARNSPPRPLPSSGAGADRTGGAATTLARNIADSADRSRKVRKERVTCPGRAEALRSPFVAV